MRLIMQCDHRFFGGAPQHAPYRHNEQADQPSGVMARAALSSFDFDPAEVFEAAFGHLTLALLAGFADGFAPSFAYSVHNCVALSHAPCDADCSAHTVAGLMISACTEPRQVSEHDSGRVHFWAAPWSCTVLMGSFWSFFCPYRGLKAATLPEPPLLLVYCSHAELCEICFASPSFKLSGSVWHALHLGHLVDESTLTAPAGGDTGNACQVLLQASPSACCPSCAWVAMIFDSQILAAILSLQSQCHFRQTVWQPPCWKGGDAHSFLRAPLRRRDPATFFLLRHLCADVRAGAGL